MGGLSLPPIKATNWTSEKDADAGHNCSKSACLTPEPQSSPEVYCCIGVPSTASLDSHQHSNPGTNTTPIQEHPPGQLHPRRRGGSGGGGTLTSVAYSSSSDGELIQQQQQLLQETPGVLATTAGAPTYLPAAALGLGLHQHPLVAHGGPPGGCCAVTTSHNIGKCEMFKITAGLPKQEILLYLQSG